METAPPPPQTTFFLTKLLEHITRTHVSYDKAFRAISKRYEVPKWLYGTFYKLGYYVTLYYYALRWIAGVHGYGTKPAGIISYFQSIGFSIRRFLRIVEKETKNLSPVKRISIRYSYPEYLVRDLMKHLSLDEIERYLAKLNERKVWLRINTLKTSIDKALKCLDDEGVKYRVDNKLDYMIYIESPKWLQPGKLDCVKKGLLIPQDIASAWVVETLLKLDNATIVLDACSAPGIKLGLLMARKKKNIRAIAVDKSWRRINILKKLLPIQGVDNFAVNILNADSSEIEYRIQFPLALVDAPCSGSGAVSGDPAIKISIERKGKLEYYHNNQVLILKNTLKHSKRVVYAVCSIHPYEGEEVIKEILSKNLARVIEIDIDLPKAYRGYEFSSKTYRTYPHLMNSQGFYIAALEAK